MMCKRLLTISLCIGLGASVSAQPYGWLTGSTADSPKTGNRMVILDLGSGSVVGPADGWQYTGHSAGADPTAPSFSPNGDVAYVLVGGDGNASLPTGYLYLFDTDDVIAKLGNSQTPDPPFQTISFPSSDEDAVEPVAVTVAQQGDRVYLVEGKEEHLFVFDVQGDRTLSQVAVLDTGEGPGPFWLTGDGDQGYFVNFEEFTVNVVDCRANPPQITQTIPVPPPTKSESFSQPGTFCAFPHPSGTSMSLIPPPGEAPSDSSKLLIYSGYYGFKTYLSFPTPTYITANDNFRVYSLDTATNTLDNAGAPILDVTPGSSQITFPPTLHAFDNGSGERYVHTAGSVVIKPDGSTHELTFPAQNIMPVYGLQHEGTGAILIGSIPAADAIALAGGSYAPVRNSSMILRYDDPHSPSATQVAATNVYDVDRYLSIPLGYHDSKFVFGATDAYGLKGLPVPTGSLRDTKIVLYDPVSDTASEIPTQVVGGAYAEQPTPGYDPTDSDGDGFTDQVEIAMGTDKDDPLSWPNLGDFNGDGFANMEDSIELMRQALDNGGSLPFDSLLDVNLDGVVDTNDALTLLGWSYGVFDVIPRPD